MEGEGIHYLNITARDNLGNMVQDAITFCTDDTPPVTEKFVDSTLWNQSYYILNTTQIWLNATDYTSHSTCFAGFKYLHYEIWYDSNNDNAITGDDTQVYMDDSSLPSVHFTLIDHGITEGLCELRYYAVDMLDNQAPLHTQLHQIVNGTDEPPGPPDGPDELDLELLYDPPAYDYITDFCEFGDYLYVCTGSYPSRIYRTQDGLSWTMVWERTDVNKFWDMEVFNGYIYVGLTDYGGIYRSSDGTNWAQAHSGSLDYTCLQAFNGYLYAGTHYDAYVDRTADGTTWNQVLDAPAATIEDFCVFNGKIYAVSSGFGTGYMYQSDDGLTWTSIASIPVNFILLQSGNNAIWGGTPTLYRSIDGATWNPVSTPGGASVTAIAEYQGETYMGIGNTLYKTLDGSTWTSVGTVSDVEIVELYDYMGDLYVGTSNGGMIYRLS